MSRKRRPAYLLHKSTGQARVRIDGKAHYLWLHNSPESLDRYEALVSDWLRKNEERLSPTLRVDALVVLWQYIPRSYSQTADIPWIPRCFDTYRHQPEIASDQSKPKLNQSEYIDYSTFISAAMTEFVLLRKAFGHTRSTWR